MSYLFSNNIAIFNSNNQAITTTTPLPVTASIAGGNLDAFGRLRISQPLTLFDSFFRYNMANTFSYSNTAGTTIAFNSNTASIDMSLPTTSGASVYKETNRVFAYQPGKSLLIMTTFVMNPAKNNLRQRVGYFGANNGFFLECSANTVSNVSLVKRSTVTGATVDTHIDQADWNIDTLSSSSRNPSGITLNLNYPQILFTQIEWLGVGTATMGFVIDGKYVPCHAFNHANRSDSPLGAYMQTACLPVRAEIENTAGTASTSLFKHICSSVISEGGYELSGQPRCLGQDPTPANQIQLVTAGTYYPVVSIRLKSTNLDAIVIPKEVAILPINAGNYRYQVIKNATIGGANWTSFATDSSVEYNANSTATVSGGTVISSGYVSSTVQGGGSITLSDSLFKYQLERNSFTATPATLTLVVTCGTATSNVVANLGWEEVTL